MATNKVTLHSRNKPYVPSVRPASEGEDPIRYTQTLTVDVPKEVLRRNRVIAADPDEAHSNAYRMLRTRIMHRLRRQDCTTLAITSPGAGAGKTLTSINLAISIAMEINKTVLLVDADLRRPSVHKFFGLSPAAGLSDYLVKRIPLGQMLINPGIARFVVLPGGRPLLNSSEMLASPRMTELVDELKTRYESRYVVFDLPPVLAVDDALAFTPHVDAPLLVVEEGQSKDEEVRHCLDLLNDSNLIGAVLNKSVETSDSYYSYYYY